MPRFTSFTKKFSRQSIGLVIALFMLFAPAFIATAVSSAQTRRGGKISATPKKKATPAKKAQARSTPKKTPTPTAKKKTATKSSPQTASKNKASSNNRLSSKNSKNSAKTNQNRKDILAKNSRSKNTKESSKTTAKSNNKNAKNNKTRPDSSRTASAKTTKNKPTITKTNTRTTKTAVKKAPKKTVETEPKTTETASGEIPQIIVTTLSVPVRSQAKADAVPLSSFKLGTVLTVMDKNPAWYKVQFVSGGKYASGWVSANSVNDLNQGEKEEIYRQIVERNYRQEMDFAAASELYEFLTNVNGELVASDSAAEMELKRLLALRSALKSVPVDKKEMSPYREFLATHEREIVYSEPAGEYLVVSNLFWNLHKKYPKSPLSDSIAWQAAQNPLPGECEGYINCHLFDMRMRLGEYLNLHPNGQHSAQALRDLTAFFEPIVTDLPQKSVYTGPTDVTDRAEFNNLVAELRTIVSRLGQPEKEKTLQQLKQIGEAFR
jgi:hypothetical protein